MKKSRYIMMTAFALVLVVALWFIFPKLDHRQPPRSEPQLKIKTDKQNANELKGVIRPDHIVIVVEENHSLEQIIGNEKAPYINELANKGALMTNSHGVVHPSQPNYLVLFSGSTQGVKNDSCPHQFTSNNLALQLKKAGKTFAGYSEDLPKIGFTGCSSRAYVRKHNPWVNFKNVPQEVNVPFHLFPKDDFSNLPTVSFVIPNLDHDIHDGTIAEADQWLKKNIGPYVQWAQNHNSLLILTWDEDDFRRANHIPTLFVGPMVKPGKYSEYIDHYNVLRTIQALYRLPPLEKSESALPITNIWK